MTGVVSSCAVVASWVQHYNAACESLEVAKLRGPLQRQHPLIDFKIPIEIESIS